MLADRRIRQFKERLDAGAVIPEEFVTIAKEILTDPEAEGLVSLLVDAYLSAPLPPPAAASDGEGNGHPREREPRDESQGGAGRPAGNGGGRGRSRGPRRPGGRS